MVRLLASLALALCALTAVGAATDTSERIFDRRFRTLKVETADNFMAPPVIRMGTDDRITIKFDEIGEDNSYLE